MLVTGSALNAGHVQNAGSGPHGLYWDRAYNAGAILAGCEALLDGAIVCFAVCERSSEDPPRQFTPPIVKEFVTLGVPPGVRCVRFCGGDSGRDPLGHFSYTLWGSVEDGGNEPIPLAEIVARVSADLYRRGKWVYYLKEPDHV